MSNPKTNITVELTGHDGNAFSILGKVKKALEEAGHKDLAKEYMKEAMSKDYDNLLQITMEYVNVE